jgi:hypothetical protein
LIPLLPGEQQRQPLAQLWLNRQIIVPHLTQFSSGLEPGISSNADDRFQG